MAATDGAEVQTTSGRKRRRRRSKFAMSAEDSVLAFVTANKSPTTQEVNQHFAAEGRGGSADNTLSKLVKEGRLLREPLKDQRGSRYNLP